MAIPAKPLEITIEWNAEHPGKRTLAEQELFYSTDNTFNILDFKQWLLEHSNWTRKEINAICNEDLGQVHAQVMAKLREAVIPLASAPS